MGLHCFLKCWSVPCKEPKKEGTLSIAADSLRSSGPPQVSPHTGRSELLKKGRLARENPDSLKSSDFEKWFNHEIFLWNVLKCSRMFEIVVQCHDFVSNQFKSIQFSFIQLLMNFESHQAHQNPENPSNMGVRVPSKRFPSSPLKNALCPPPVPKSCSVFFHFFSLVMGVTDVEHTPQYSIKVYF